MVCRAVFSALLLLLTVAPSFARTIVVAVEDKDWSPYYEWVGGQPRGACTEIAAGAIRQMGDEVKFVRLPWVRVLQSVKSKKVDAGLCGTRTAERESFSYYPDEPLLGFDVTLFARADSPLKSSAISGLSGKSFGLVKGYNFGGVDARLEKAGMIRIEAPKRSNLLKMLEIGRLDTILDSTLPLIADALRMGLVDDVRALKPSLAITPGYLFFSRKPGNDALARRFSNALKAFKSTEEYRKIEKRYGLGQ